MTRMPVAQLPRKRSRGLVIDELPDEILVYDLERHQAHCLNRSAAEVWQLCNGKRTASEISQRLQSKLDSPASKSSDKKLSEELVLLALRQLEKLNLLEEPLGFAVKRDVISRRELVRRLGIAAAVAAPLVTSIMAPNAAEAATCIPTGSPCSGTVMCCSVLGCDTGTNKCR